MTILTQEEALKRCRQLVGEMVEVQLDRHPPTIYNVDPDEWWLFIVQCSGGFHIGASDYVGVHRESGRAVHLGRHGE